MGAGWWGGDEASDTCVFIIRHIAIRKSSPFHQEIHTFEVHRAVLLLVSIFYTDFPGVLVEKKSIYIYIFLYCIFITSALLLLSVAPRSSKGSFFLLDSHTGTLLGRIEKGSARVDDDFPSISWRVPPSFFYSFYFEKNIDLINKHI